MAKKDKTTKKLEDHPEVFADIYNVLMFQREFIKENQLEAGPTVSIYKAEGHYREQMRDIIKKYKGADLDLISLGIENQSKVDQDMPVRVMGYDYASYRRQIDEKKKLHPVLTMVLNFSKEDWNKPDSLIGLFDVDDELKQYVQDYKIHVVDVHKLDKETIHKFKSDFKYIAAFFKYGKNYLKQFSEDEALDHPEEVIDLIRVFNEGDIVNVEKDMIEKVRKGEVITMCNIVQEIQEEGRQEGRQEGIEILILDNLEEGISEERIIEKLQKRFNLSEEKAVLALHKYGKVVQ